MKLKKSSGKKTQIANRKFTKNKKKKMFVRFVMTIWNLLKCSHSNYALVSSMNSA